MKETAPLRNTEDRELMKTLTAALELLQEASAEGSSRPRAKARQLKEAYERALFAANRLGELWMAARFDAGEFEPHKRPTQAAALVERAVQTLDPKAEQNEVQLTTRFEQLPPIHGDPELLQSLLSNLLAGIIDISTQGTQILISGFQRKDEILLKIEDQEDRIGKELFPNLVSSGEDGRSASGSNRPLDVGTLMVKPIIDAHDGHIWIERQGEAGSALFLAFPMVEQQEAQQPQTDKKVLIVDDDPDGAFMLEQALTKGGFITELAHDGISGLAKARGEDIGLVLLDVMLPGIDGFEVCNRLRSDPATADLPIVMISAKSRPEDRETGMRMGANDYLNKPLRLADILEKANEFIQQ